MKWSKILVLLLVVLACSFTYAAEKNSGIPAEEQGTVITPNELKELAEKIKVAENGIYNIKIESSTWEEHGTSTSGPWEQTPVHWFSTAWFTGNWSCHRWNEQQKIFEKHIEGKARVDVYDEVLEVRQSAFPYGKSSYSVGFDGQHGRITYHTRGHLEETHLKKEGKLLPHAPEDLASGSCASFTGIRFSLQFFEGEIYKFSKMFELASDPNSKAASELNFTREEFLGVECIKISSNSGNLMYWLDPSHGFTLRGKMSFYTSDDGHKELVDFVKATSLEEVAPGIWWPAEIISISRPYEKGGPWRKVVCLASNIVANDPNFDEKVFTVPFPKGYLIDDKVTGRKYKVGEDPNAPKEQPKK